MGKNFPCILIKKIMQRKVGIYNIICMIVHLFEILHNIENKHLVSASMYFSYTLSSIHVNSCLRNISRIYLIPEGMKISTILTYSCSKFENLSIFWKILDCLFCKNRRNFTPILIFVMMMQCVPGHTRKKCILKNKLYKNLCLIIF